MRSTIVFLALVSGIPFVYGCQDVSTDGQGDAPTLETDGISELGSASLTDWSISVVADFSTMDLMAGTGPSARVTFTKLGGSDTSRPGGACLVTTPAYQVPSLLGPPCTTAATCPPVQYANGINYCVAMPGDARRCWVRPGSQAAYCSLGPGNVNGSSRLAGPSSFDGQPWGAVACLASAQSSTACAQLTPGQYVYATETVLNPFDPM